MGDVKMSDGAGILPPDARQRELPICVTWLLCGAETHENWKGKADTVGLSWDGRKKVLSRADYDCAVAVADKIAGHFGKRVTVPSVACGLDICEMAARELARQNAGKDRESGILMLKDRTGSGYWRMVFPARYMKKDGIYIDITSAGVSFDQVLEYDTVYVQRLHDWESVYMLERLKSAGKRIVYDLDDDIFHLEKTNPAFEKIKRDEQMAAAECMKIADAVTVTTTTLQAVVRNATEGVEAVVMPNAIDLDDGWVPTPVCGSQDGIRRMFWQGSDTHGEDWQECISAVDAVMCENEDVRLVIVGYLSPSLFGYLKKPGWKGKVEYLEFKAPETYFRLMKFIRAEVGLAPLKDTLFNRSKSELKFIEYAAMGIPTVASDVLPYVDVIDDGENGYLAKSQDEWYAAIKTCLDDNAKRIALVNEARKEVSENYSIKRMAEEWRTLLARKSSDAI